MIDFTKGIVSISPWWWVVEQVKKTPCLQMTLMYI